MHGQGKKTPRVKQTYIKVSPCQFYDHILKVGFCLKFKDFYCLHSALNIDSSQTQKILLPVPIKRSDFIAMIGWASEHKYKVRSYHIGHESNICFATWPLSNFHVY